MESEERSKQINAKFESILPKLWQKSRENVETLKIEYMKTLHTKLLDVIRNQLTIPAFYNYFTGFSIEDISSDVSIIFGTNTTLKKEILEFEYLSLLRTALTSITGVDYEISIVVNEENSVPESLEGKTLEELWIMAYGEKDLEERKALHQKRKLKSDYGEGEINLTDCLMCGCNEVPNTDISIELKLGGALFIDSTFRGAKCTQCNEMYFNTPTSDYILKLAKVFDELFPEQISREVK
ncbi:hypothetical protein [Paenibacillus sp. FSL R5-0345]|uniref:hypothetical protein n=1 Tax=unclassified Paenibacillus TaxID=185978 RepID=UPI0004F6331C|nr:hypothetical protein [Paenibacillus sp. FSL R5-0345]AIQ34041.1 hypothetical protein R50345_04910 [Paenibacillus sp. FSL R5-0345]